MGSLPIDLKGFKVFLLLDLIKRSFNTAKAEEKSGLLRSKKRKNVVNVGSIQRFFVGGLHQIPALVVIPVHPTDQVYSKAYYKPSQLISFKLACVCIKKWCHSIQTCLLHKQKRNVGKYPRKSFIWVPIQKQNWKRQPWPERVFLEDTCFRNQILFSTSLWPMWARG